MCLWNFLIKTLQIQRVYSTEPCNLELHLVLQYSYLQSIFVMSLWNFSKNRSNTKINSSQQYHLVVCIQYCSTVVYSLFILYVYGTSIHLQGFRSFRLGNLVQHSVLQYACLQSILLCLYELLNKTCLNTKGFNNPTILYCIIYCSTVVYSLFILYVYGSSQ